MIDIKGRTTYSNCVSLGWNCATASSLSRLGLRSCSGPFDWYFSSYSGVLKQIEMNFLDFMNYDNLELDKTNERVFIDKKYGFICNHDIKKDFEAEWKNIHQKYKRRVTRFLEMVKQPTCFFRCIRDEDEVAYVNAEWEHAQKLLQKYNPNNCIIYIYRKGLNGLTDQVQSFALSGLDVLETYEQRYMFETSLELTNFCSSLLPKAVIQRNTLFDRHEGQTENAAIIDKCVREGINGIDRMILQCFGEASDTGIYLYGGGRIGIRLAKYLQERGVTIKGVIDSFRSEGVIEGFDVSSLDAVETGACIFLSVLNGKANDNIVKQIDGDRNDLIVRRFQDLSQFDIATLLKRLHRKTTATICDEGKG